MCKNVFLYGCETSSLTLREERMLRVSENRVLRIVVGPKRDEVTGEWKDLLAVGDCTMKYFINLRFDIDMSYRRVLHPTYRTHRTL
jgi:hypothetical protein